MTPQQEQSAIDWAKEVLDTKNGYTNAPKYSNMANVLLSLHGRLEEAESIQQTLCGEAEAVGYYGEVPDSALTCMRVAIQQAILQPQADQLRAELAEARATILKCSENTADALRERDEARRQLDIARKAFHSILVQKAAYGQCLEVVSPECYEGIAVRALSQITPTETQS